MPINRVRYVISDPKNSYRNDPEALVAQTSFILDVYESLLSKSSGHRMLAIHGCPFDYTVKPIKKDAAKKLEAMGIAKLNRRSFKSLAEAELGQHKKPDGTIETFGLDFDRPVSAGTASERATGKAGGTEPFITSQIKKMAATLIIQSTWRMYRSKSRIRSALDNPKWSDENTDQEELLSVYSTGSNRLPLAVDYMFSDRVQSRYKAYYEKIGHRVNVNMSYLEFSALLIQRNFRMYRIRKQEKKRRELEAELKKKQEEEAALLAAKAAASEGSQNPTTSNAQLNNMLSTLDPVNSAITRSSSQSSDGIDENSFAAKIQGAWRRYCFRETFRFMKDLVFGFHMNGDPKKLLSFINPKESEYMDNAAGLHIRFRVGGESFPPQLFYRIYTHKPLVDMNSFSPRPNYSILSGLQNSQPKHVKMTKLKHTLQMLEDEGWYSRPETNEWRPVSVHVLDPFYPSAMIKFQIQKTYPKVKDPAVFHYSQLVRRQDLLAKRKCRRRDWLRKIYAQGNASDNISSQKSVVKLNLNLETVPNEELDDFFRYLDDGALDSEEPNDLIEWASKLDFQDYFNNWFMVGASGFTDLPYSLKMPEDLRHIEADALEPSLKISKEAAPVISASLNYSKPISTDIMQSFKPPSPSQKQPSGNPNVPQSRSPSTNPNQRGAEDIIQRKTLDWENAFSSK